MKNLKVRLPALVIAAALVLSLFSCGRIFPGTSPEPSAPVGSADVLLDELAQDYLKETSEKSTLDMHFNVAYPEGCGIERPEPTLGRVYGDDIVAEYEAMYQAYLDRLGEIPRNKLSLEYRYAYDNWELLLQSSLELNDDTMFSELYAPLNSLGIQLLLVLNEYRFYTAADIDDYIGILLDTPRFFAETNEYELARADLGYVMSDRAADDLIEQCLLVTENPEELFLLEVFIGKVDSFAAEHPELTEDAIADYKQRGTDALKTSLVPAYQSVADTAQLLRDNYDGEFTFASSPEAKDKYEQLVQHSIGTTNTLRKIRSELAVYIT
ncbi:MAG: DUF885 family protein, partial [Oscillospiraceae bacterium]|nr:DUF885 family protein [Oscillospiraceae bacterium]